MWLIVLLAAALAASAAYIFIPSANRKKFKPGLLLLMLWGATIMVAVDHFLAFLSGEPFIEFETDGTIQNSVLLGFAMVIPIFLIWAVAVFVQLQYK
ncbi:MAG: putative membrane protein [Candidatus Jorgensenbacteria bacterium GW2011_GWA2_45_13]|uniref:Putative membrane protein n=1 Tax=Candidatus Jorgensenbacteria bacterium GW2011_GWA2_45_13 TaxID=1618662 RepID=A0A0G1NDW5_9BACT|nr:MAG: putative membrane protein [Candidatus Jorgensenbacteria bacterium GW2011_GWA2_45_13]HIH29876.1 hypothetical protein [Candidatus Micrarchaeota archaeon]